MANPIDDFLNDVRKSLRHRLPQLDPEPILQETEQHLRERVTAARELGDGWDLEREAVEAFGPADAYVKALFDVHVPDTQAERSVLRTLGLFGVVLILLVTFGPAASEFISNLFFLEVLIALILGTAARVTYLSTRTRRILPGRIVGVSVLTGIAGACFLSLFWLNLYSEGGTGYVPVWYQPESQVPTGKAHLDVATTMNVVPFRDASNRPYLMKVAANIEMAPNFAFASALVGLTGNLIGVAWGRRRARRRVQTS